MAVRVGLVGVGQMGKGMGSNLLKQKFQLTVFDKFPTANQETLRTAGASVAASLHALAGQSDVVISMVQNDAQVTQVVTEIIQASKTKKTFVDCSTVSPATSKALLQTCLAHGHDFLDAPVSGGVNGAMNGALTLMVGASSDQIFEQVKPVLLAMGKPVRCGLVGAGAAVKLANNLMLAINMVSAVEGYKLAKNLGVDLAVFNEVVNSASGQSWVTSKYNPVPGLMAGVPAAREYRNGFTIDLMLKDLGLALELAEGDAEAAEFCRGVYQKAKSELGGDLDFGAIFVNNKP